MICPYCATGIRFETLSCQGVSLENPNSDGIPFSVPESHEISHGYCPECHKLIVLLREECQHNFPSSIDEIIFPRKKSTKPLPIEIPERYRNDFEEASSVLDLSAKASAAISRRLLQDILQNHYQIKKRDLENEIEEFIKINTPPTYLADPLHHIRKIGNFAAHPKKNTNTGEVIDVEPGEAEWLLNSLETLFDFAFVQPERLKQRQLKVDLKVQSAQKPPP